MKRLFTHVLMLLAAGNLQAQVVQNIVLEHFTNTKCSICASRNPGLFTNLANNPNVIHIAVHPSSPYSSCVLYQHNTTENDARTNYYGILGGTPRIVINGEVQSSSTSFASATLFDNFNAKTSPISIAVSQKVFGSDSLVSTIVVKTVSANTLASLQLYIPLVEDSLAYSAPNGETLHHNVFRKVLLDQSIAAPAIGDSLTYSVMTLLNPVWKSEKLKTIAMVQTISDKKMIQAQSSAPSSFNSNSSKVVSNGLFIELFPNPVTNKLFIKGVETGTVTIYNLDGKGVLIHDLTITKELPVFQLTKGVYMVKVENAEGIFVGKVLKY